MELQVNRAEEGSIKECVHAKGHRLVVTDSNSYKHSLANSTCDDLFDCKSQPVILQVLAVRSLVMP